MTFETVDYSAADGVARLVLNRPERLNAINRSLIRDLRSAVQAANVPPDVASAVLIGVDLGPNLSVTGSLARDHPMADRSATGRRARQGTRLSGAIQSAVAGELKAMGS